MQQELCTNIRTFFSKTSFGFAEQMNAPGISAVKYRDLPPHVACLAEPLGVALDMHRLADIRIGSVVVVSGVGAIGLMALRLAKLSGAGRIYAASFSRLKVRNDMAGRFGADDVIYVDRTPLDKFKFPQAPDRFMVSAPPSALPPAIAVAAKGGIISYIGIQYGAGAQVSFDANVFHFKKLQLRGAFASPALLTHMALRVLKSGAVDGAALVTHRFGLDEIKQALHVACREKETSIKVVVECNN
jgi:threonine dehydrogenase-like Zn-dependent dehydrogenase